MDFKEATDALFDQLSHQELADALGISVASIRQARLRPDAKARRAPPAEWRNSVMRIAENRVWHYRKLIERLREEGSNK